MAATIQRIKDPRVARHAGNIQPAKLTADQYCQRYQIGRHTLYRAVKQGLIKAYRFGAKTVRYDDAPPAAE
jgi:excisionase family DNA binding protein